MGLHTSYIINGYNLALKKAIEILEGMSVLKVTDPKNKE